MRNMSFTLTTAQIRNRSKTVTRRRGWRKLRVGERVCACVKCQGLRPGERIERLATLEIVSVRRERLNAITARDVELEGFGCSPAEFVAMYCQHMGGRPTQTVTRIEFRYITGALG